MVLCGARGKRRFMDADKPAPFKARFIAVFICSDTNALNLRVNADNKPVNRQLYMGVGFCFAAYGHTGGSFLRGDIYIPPFFKRGFHADCGNIRIHRQFQRMRGITAQGIIIQVVLYHMVGDSMRMLRFGDYCAGGDIKLGLLERRSQKAFENVGRDVLLFMYN